jgi:hypothetical protein
MSTQLANRPPSEPAELSGAGLFVEARRETRYPLAATVLLGWIDEKKHLLYQPTQGIDVSQTGIAVATLDRIRVTALVDVRIAEDGPAGLGRVRSCIRWGAGWRVGIEMRRGS